MVAQPQGSAPSLDICSEENAAAAAAAERVFSILKSSFNDQQEQPLVDYLQANVMTQYNKRWLTSTFSSMENL